MAKVPTYQDLNRQRAEEAAMQSQTEQRNTVAQNTQVAADSNKNPVLAEYMSRNTVPQGLLPRDNGKTYDYSTIAGEIAGIVPNQQAYSSAMVDAVMKGQVPAESVLADANVLDQAKAGLVNVMRQNQGLGQLA